MDFWRKFPQFSIRLFMKNTSIRTDVAKISEISREHVLTTCLCHLCGNVKLW